MLLGSLALAAAGPPTPRSVQDGGVTVAYLDRGSGPAIVLIASLGRSAADFDALSGMLNAAGFRTVAPEPRGIGGSLGPLQHPTLHDYAADVALAIRDAGVAPCVVLGHAYGNIVARTVAADHPALVRGVILLAPSGRVPYGQDIKDAIGRSSDLSLPDDVRRRALAAAYFAPGHDPAAWMDGWFPAAQAGQWEATRTAKADEYTAAGGHVPILDILAADDAINPASNAEELRRELGDRVTVVVVPHAGHALVPEQPRAVADAIAGWMRTL